MQIFSITSARISKSDIDGIIVESYDYNVSAEEFAEFMNISFINNKYILSESDKLEAIMLYFSWYGIKFC